MANRWGNNGNSGRLHFLELQKHRDNDRSHEIKRHLLLGNFPGGSNGKASPAVREAWVQSLSQEGSPGEGNGNPLQYSCLEYPHGQRSLVGLQSMVWQRVRHDRATSLSSFLSLLLGRKGMTKLNSVLKSRDITLSTKVHLVRAMVFPVVMYGCESWTIKKAEHWRIDAFELWCWRRRLRVPWTARRSKQLILKEINPEYSLKRLMLKLQYLGHLMWRPDSEKTWCWERLKAGGEGDDKGWDGWMASPMQWTWVCVGSGGWWWTGKPGVLQSMGSQRVRHNWATEQQLCILSSACIGDTNRRKKKQVLVGQK